MRFLLESLRELQRENAELNGQCSGVLYSNKLH